MAKRKQLPERWQKEKQASRAVQVAFDIEEQVQKTIRREAIDRSINPSDRVREILGLEVTSKPKRLRLSISLSDSDFHDLAKAFKLEPNDRVKIKQVAAERLAAHVSKAHNRG